MLTRLLSSFIYISLPPPPPPPALALKIVAHWFMAIITNLFNYNYSTFTVDFSVSKLNGLTWRENYAGSSGLSAAKRPADLMSARTTDAVRVSCIVLKLFKYFVNFIKTSCVLDSTDHEIRVYVTVVSFAAT